MKPWAVLAVGSLAAIAALIAVLTLGGPGDPRASAPAANRSETQKPEAGKRGSDKRAMNVPTPEGDISEQSREELREWLRDSE